MYMEKSIGALCGKEVKKRLRGKKKQKDCVEREQRSVYCMEGSKERLCIEGAKEQALHGKE
jgi:hypothetical protein